MSDASADLETHFICQRVPKLPEKSQTGEYDDVSRINP